MADESRVSTEVASTEGVPEPDSQSEDMSIDTQGTKKRKVMQSRSKVWDHFDKVFENGVLSKAQCNYCKRLYAAQTSGGTSGLNNHLGRCSVYAPTKKRDSAQQKLPFQPVSDDKTNWKFDQEEVRRALVEMIIVDELPFSFVEKEGFKKFLSVAQPMFHIPSRRTVTRDCYKIYAEHKNNLKMCLREVGPKVCLTTDTWTSVQRINYMCLTAHFIDRDWVLHKRILNFCPITSHKGEDMAEVISSCLLDWRLENVFTLTVDNAGSNNTTIVEVSKQLTDWGTNLMEGQHLHMRCTAHILNLIVQDGLKEIGSSVKRVRQVVRYIKQSAARLRKFKECVERQKIDYNKALVLDVPTRWNSTYLMLEVAQHYESAFDRFDAGPEKVLSKYLSSYVCEDGSVAGGLESKDWVNVRNVIKFLARFYDLTVKVSGSLYVTANSHFEEICELYVYLKMCILSDDLELSKMADEMKKKFEKYWGNPFNMNKMIFIASVLDPRNKFVFVGFALEEMYGKIIGDKIEAEVKTYLTKLYAHYAGKYSSGMVGSQSPSSSTSSSELSTDSLSGCSGNVVRNKLQLKRQKEDIGSVGTKSELEKYLSEDQEHATENFDVLRWWKMNAPRFPILSELARDVLAIPISSVASECAFSTGGRILDSFRSSLTPKCVQTLICVQDWLRSEPVPISMDENLDYLEQIELEMADYARDSCIVDV